MAQATMPPAQEQDMAGNDYLVEGESEQPALSVRGRVVWVLRLILMLIVAAISLALFWVVWTALGLI